MSSANLRKSFLDMTSLTKRSMCFTNSISIISIIKMRMIYWDRERRFIVSMTVICNSTDMTL